MPFAGSASSGGIGSLLEALLPPTGSFRALLRVGTQTKKFLRIHAQLARHLDLPTIEAADLLRVSARVRTERILSGTGQKWHGS
ncbi:MAG: hypothetical protein JOZ14_14975 [Acidobacteria bacterium]|nr:hypothetical protein [Acidobacteriota bacterium]